MGIEALNGQVACPVDRLPLEVGTDGAACPSGHRYHVGGSGYLELASPDSPVLAVESTSEEGVHGQESGGARVYEAYLRPWVERTGARTVLDAGCGIGTTVASLRADGYAAIGTDMRGVARVWERDGRDPAAFVVGDAIALPFPDDSFDAAMTLGVMEHVGTTTGHLTLAPGWRDTRRAFARELRRVVRPGGRILLACPNKWFPVDVQHGPVDAETSAPVRNRIFERFKVNIHPTWGAYHLPSYRDLDGWYGRGSVHPLPLTGYFGFSALERPGMPAFVARAGRAWVDDLPPALRRSPLNPYVLAEISC